MANPDVWRAAGNPVTLPDGVGGYAYFGTNTSPGTVVKICLSDFTRVGALTLSSGENYLRSAVINPAGGFAYFGTLTTPGKVIKVRLSDFTRVGALTLNVGENRPHSGVIDPEAGYAYFGTDTIPGIVVKVRLSDFTRVGAVTLNSGENTLQSAVIDPSAGYAYFGTYTQPGYVVKVALSLNDAVRATRITVPETAGVQDVRFYSHLADGNLRLAIYDEGSTKTLRWQSDSTSNTVANGWVTVPISSGTPSSLALPPGTYWLAFNTDSIKDTASYTSGTALGDGFLLDQPYGPFPSKVGTSATQPVFDTWSMYLTYETLPAAPGNPGATAIGTDTITWTWTDDSSNETGFKVWTDAGRHVAHNASNDNRRQRHLVALHRTDTEFTILIPGRGNQRRRRQRQNSQLHDLYAD